MNNDIEQYLQMQKEFYIPQSLAHAKTYIGVGDGCWSKETLEIARKRFVGSDNYDRGVDFGCGVGRLIAKFHPQFNHIDGVDISEQMLKYAHEYLQEQNVPKDKYTLHQCHLQMPFLKNNTYDIVYSNIVLHHICVWRIRNIYFQEFYRILKPGGHISIELFGGLNFDVPAASKWYDNTYDAVETNSFHDVKLENPYFVVNDLAMLGFKAIRIFFYHLDPNNNGCARHEFSMLVKAFK